MTTTFSFPKLAYGFALAATLVSGSTAHASVWTATHLVAAPERPASSRSPAGRHARLKAALVLTDPATGGNSPLAGQSARPQLHQQCL